MDFQVIKENDLFLMTDLAGNVPVSPDSPYGLYAQDTRLLSGLVCTMGPMNLMQLSADASDNYVAVYHYTNQELRNGDTVVVPRESLLVTRKQFVDGVRFYEEITVLNYGLQPVDYVVSFELKADFEDMFVVRGFKKSLPSPLVCVSLDNGAAVFSYTAPDGVQCRTAARFRAVAGDFSGLSEDVVIDINDCSAVLGKSLTVPAGGEAKWTLVVDLTIKGDPLLEHQASQSSYESTYTPLQSTNSQQKKSVVEASMQRISSSYSDWLARSPEVHGDPAFSTWYRRGLLDLRMLLTDQGAGPFAVAGVPWFAVLFGRDSLISAIQLLSAHPEVARGTLKTMAIHQGRAVNPWRDEQPGKIMHELRNGELTRTNQVPFGPYYGTIDATPLFLVLAAEYFLWTGDRAFLSSILTAILSGFQWLDEYGDRDGDGLIEYSKEADRGIVNQGWKDSGDAIVHKNGALATGPIALCEVQGYAYRAYQLWSRVFTEFNLPEMAATCGLRAQRLQSAFLERFWMDDQDAVALAVDGSKNRVESLSSNMGQVLWSGILPPTFAERLVNRLLASDLYSGYGVRTLASSEIAYNPLSYHNGTVWPHDNSIIIAGMQRYGQRQAAATLVSGLLDAARCFPFMRLPELFAGYGTDEVRRPMPYPVSCSPQAWAAGSPVLVLQALLGLEPDVLSGCLRLNPVLPAELETLTVSGIRVGSGRLDVLLHRSLAGETTVSVQKNTTGLRVMMGPALEVVVPAQGELRMI